MKKSKKLLLFILTDNNNYLVQMREPDKSWYFFVEGQNLDKIMTFTAHYQWTFAKKRWKKTVLTYDKVCNAPESFEKRFDLYKSLIKENEIMLLNEVGVETL